MITQDLDNRGDSPSTARPSGRYWGLLPLVAAVVFVLLAAHAAKVETPTVDEFAHLPAGCAYWTYGRLDLYAKNPPLLKYWMALPISLDSRVVVPEVTESPLGWGPWRYGTRFMEANRPHYFELFFLARLMIIILGLLTGLVLYYWARDIFNGFGAAVAATLFFLSPTILAHAHLATIDVGSMFTIFLSVFTLRWAYKKPSAGRILLSGAVLGLALATKFTAVLLLPILVGLQLVYRRQSRHTVQKSWLLGWGKDALLLVLAALFVVNTLMVFRGSFRPLGGYKFHASVPRLVQKILPAKLPVPLPEDYVIGFDAQNVDTESGEFGSYLLGKWSRTGWWCYNFVVLGVKTAVPLLIMVLVSPWCWRRLGLPSRETWTVFLPIVTFLVIMSLFNSLNIGIRYLLPIFPFLFLAVGAVCARLWKATSGPWLKMIPLAVIIYHAVAIASIHPGYLSYFNLLAGGSANGQAWLLDSNLDWGQDLYRVREVTRRLKGDNMIGILYFGHVDPSLYGIRYGLVPPWPIKDVMAVSMNFLKGYPYVATAPDGRMHAVKPGHLKWLREKEPVVRLGSILIYDTRGDAQVNFAD